MSSFVRILFFRFPSDDADDAYDEALNQPVHTRASSLIEVIEMTLNNKNKEQRRV